MPADEAGQGIHQVTETQGEQPVPVSAAKPQAAPKASPAPSRPAEQPQPQASESDLDPSYYRERAAGYRRRLQSIIRNRRPGPLADVMSSVVINLQQWEERVGELADRLTTFERDAIIQRDIKEVPATSPACAARSRASMTKGYMSKCSGRWPVTNRSRRCWILWSA